MDSGEKEAVDSFWDADLYTGDDGNLDELGQDKLEDIHVQTAKFFEKITAHIVIIVLTSMY